MTPWSIEAAALLAQLHLSDSLRKKVSVLAHGKRRLLEIAIALASRPRVLLLDEPMAGVPAPNRARSSRPWQHSRPTLPCC